MLPLNKYIVGDSLKQLKLIDDDSVDLCVTSPPYNKLEGNRGHLVDKVVYDEFVDKVDEDLYQESQIDILNEMYRIIKPGGSMFYNHRVRWEKGVTIHPLEWILKCDWKFRQEIVWDRTLAGNIRGWRFWPIDERIYWLYKPLDGNDKSGKELESKHSLLTSIWRIMPNKNTNHPASFPIELSSRIIYSILVGKKGVVIDPYAGSGTTLISAKLLGSDYIGIDMSTEYKTVFDNRVDSPSKDIEKHNNEIEKHFVNKTYKQRKSELPPKCTREDLFEEDV